MTLPRGAGSAIIAILLCTYTCAAELAVSPIFSSRMVLQRNAPIVLSGQADARASVEVSLGSQTRSVKADGAGVWRVQFDPLPAGGPHIVVATAGDQQVRLEDILIGDVWVFSGQSNMQMGLAETAGGADALASLSDDIPIRLLIVPKAGAESPESKFLANWRCCSLEDASKFSAVGWYFASHLREDEQLSEVPLGLIDTSFGGTAIEAWIPAESMVDFSQEQRCESMLDIAPSHLYNKMIAPLQNYRITGVAWYQGESNAGKPQYYRELLETMIAQWRKAWGAPTLPFYIVQLPAYDGRIGNRDFSWLREAEAQACQNTDKAWLAVTYDTTPGFDLHPREKDEVGRRLARLALRTTYGRELLAESPVFRKISTDDGRVSVVFDQPVLPTGRKALRGFEVAGTDGKFRFVRATADGLTAVLDVPVDGDSLNVRYAWGSIPVANVVNVAGLPAVPFRTDSLPPSSLEFLPLPPAYRIDTPNYSLEFGRGGTIASLTVQGRQFLTREGLGGTFIPSFFGPRSLAITEVIGPQEVSVRDSEVGLRVAAEDHAMTWTIFNRGGGDIGFHISLDPAVLINADDGVVNLSRQDAVLRISGDIGVEGPHALVVEVPARKEIPLKLTLPAE